jgi:hypothetical protein
MFGNHIAQQQLVATVIVRHPPVMLAVPSVVLKLMHMPPAQDLFTLVGFDPSFSSHTKTCRQRRQCA